MVGRLRRAQWLQQRRVGIRRAARHLAELLGRSRWSKCRDERKQEGERTVTAAVERHHELQSGVAAKPLLEHVAHGDRQPRHRIVDGEQHAEDGRAALGLARRHGLLKNEKNRNEAAFLGSSTRVPARRSS
eukprot:1034303-Prymnesium_polylepis.1